MTSNRRTVLRAGTALAIGAAVVVALAVDWNPRKNEGAPVEAGCTGTAPAPGATGALCVRPPDARPAGDGAGNAAAASAGWTREAPTVVEVVSRTCAACKRMEPVVDQATHRCAGSALRVERRWVDEAEGAAFARRHAVFGVPTFLLLDAQGREVSRLVGEQPLAVLEGAMRDLSGGRCGS